MAFLTLALTGTILNNHFLFYTSWADLFGGTAPAKTISVGTAKAALAGPVSGPGLGVSASTAIPPPLPRPGQRLQRYSVTSPSQPGAAEVLVQLPVGYDPASPRRYPVVLGLHGYPSSPQSYLNAGLGDAQDQATSRRLLAPSILVIPQINVPRGLDTECVDTATGTPNVETWLTRDLPRWVLQHFPVRTDRGSWAAVGYSFGGWCAASAAMRHPDVFGAAIVLQGYFRPDFGSAAPPAGVDLRGYDLVAAAKRTPAAVSIWMATSREDRLSYPSSAQFLAAARPPTHVTAAVLPRGGHRNAVWQPLIPQAMSWLGATLPGFHA
ncbi:esterase family protein [Phycicoccus sp. MAQZ13P-2]|uniref:alpha/beta hydrolase n=1 Tax=Phycicoccus mangrovi TaxID=2840470 RepID=UPI001C0015AC|nr:alpha/beta hydrolase-fold protein [Phycicoccus mangrovi]MBT9257145.1 esterase family protein [Phycicoccus mangrovi]MBT9276356.1 esterase family protein [Phycicoccus mangrovi]